MDGTALKIIEYIAANSENGQAALIGRPELSALVSEGGKSVKDPETIIRELALDGYLSVIYTDAASIVVKPLEKGLLLLEKQKKDYVPLEKPEPPSPKLIRKTTLVSALFGLLGGIVGAAATLLIYLFFFK